MTMILFINKRINKEKDIKIKKKEINNNKFFFTKNYKIYKIYYIFNINYLHYYYYYYYYYYLLYSKSYI